MVIILNLSNDINWESFKVMYGLGKKNFNERIFRHYSRVTQLLFFIIIITAVLSANHSLYICYKQFNLIKTLTF